MSTVGVPAPGNEPPTGWGVLLKLLANWGITLRLLVLICVPTAAVVAIVAVVTVYLGPMGVSGLLMTVGGSYGAQRVLNRRRRR